MRQVSASLAFYKLGTGLYLLSLNWSLYREGSHPGVALLLAMLTSYSPAMLAPRMTALLTARWRNNHVIGGLLFATALLGVCNLSLFHDPLPRLSANLCMWACYFCLEALFDQEWARSTQTLSLPAARTSAAYLVLTQVMMIAGTILVSPLQELLGVGGVGIAVAGLYVAGAILGLLIVPEAKRSTRIAHSTEGPALALAVKAHWPLFLSLAMVWGFLSIFNMMTPTFGPLMRAADGLKMASLLSVGLAVGMTLAGLSALIPPFSRATRSSLGRLLINATAVALLFCASITLNPDLGVVTTFVLGFWFGLARMELRTTMTRELHFSFIAAFISRANALCVIVVLIFGGAFAFEIQSQRAYFLAPGMTLAVFVLLVFLSSRKITRPEERERLFPPNSSES